KGDALVRRNMYVHGVQGGFPAVAMARPADPQHFARPAVRHRTSSVRVGQHPPGADHTGSEPQSPIPNDKCPRPRAAPTMRIRRIRLNRPRKWPGWRSGGWWRNPRNLRVWTDPEIRPPRTVSGASRGQEEPD